MGHFYAIPIQTKGYCKYKCAKYQENTTITL